MEAFYIEDYLKELESKKRKGMDFYQACTLIREDFFKEFSLMEEMDTALELQKRAIMGYEKEKNFFMDKIKESLKIYGVDQETVPPWYKSDYEGIYHENWGLGGIAQWFGEDYKNSSSAKIIGDRIYFMKDGSMKLMDQGMEKTRRDQLLRAFLLMSPGERLNKDFHEIYLLDGTRITVFSGNMAKENQDVIIFRRYIIPVYTFEEQARRGTIPYNAIELFKAMVKFGPNIVVSGQVRSSKTTFLSTWQSYEDPRLEGVMVETDPEIPLHLLSPNAPIIQLLADNEELKKISKNLMRSDADYFILAEARDGTALETAVKIASKGTRRMKLTFHCKDPMDFPFDAAWEIVKTCGGDLETMKRKVAACFDYIFHFAQLKDKSKKRLKGIYEMSVGPEGEIKIVRICGYDYAADSWIWKYHIGGALREFAVAEDEEAFLDFDRILRSLAAESQAGLDAALAAGEAEDLVEEETEEDRDEYDMAECEHNN